MRPFRFLIIAALGISIRFASECIAVEAGNEAPILHWDFDRIDSGRVVDRSGHGLDGAMGAPAVQGPVGMAAQFEGEPSSPVVVEIPPELRLGRGSWSFTAMLKPVRLAIESTQPQRRIFSYGLYPKANLVMDVLESGQVTSYFCFERANGERVSTGASTSLSLVQGQWAHVALVCDRDRGRVAIYVNGYATGDVAIPAEFDGDFSLDGKLTIGSGWQNFWGLIDEVKLYRAALTADAVEAEFARLKAGFGVSESEEIVAAKRTRRLATVFREVEEAWSDGAFERVRELCGGVRDQAEAPVHFRSYAALRLAQSLVREGRREDAAAVYREISADVGFPEVHRLEAQRESARLAGAVEDDRVTVPLIDTYAAEVFVAPDGSAAGDGSEGAPVGTLQQARDRVRALRRAGVSGPIAVTVLPGAYRVEGQLTLGQEDSGTAEGPVVYRAREMGRSVFYGGTVLEGFEPVRDPAVLDRLPAEARGAVWQSDLAAQGIRDYGRLGVRGIGQSASPPTLELYVDRVPMTLARWPNEGFVGISRLIEPGSRRAGVPSVFEYVSDRHARWTGAEDPWLFGYFHFLWADATIQIGRIDPAAKTVTTREAYDYGGRGMSTEQGIQYYAFNLLEEIDTPGEWYLDREAGVVYLYPPSELEDAVVELGMFSETMVVMRGVRHVRWEGLGFDLGRYNGIELVDCEDCSILGCTVGRMAGNGIMVHGGHRNQLIGCDVHMLGRRATEVIGGDRETLTPGAHLVENCVIHDFGRIDRTYTPAIQLEGVGNRVAHNLMYNGPSSAMRIEGNDHQIEFNEVHSMVQESDDQGALELFRNATYRGVVFRHNYLHHIGKTGTEKSVHGQAGIRFDDAISGMLVYGNVFYRCSSGNFGAVQMNSGRDNLIENNVFVDCRYGITGGWYPGNSVWVALREGQELSGFYQNDLYLSRYPKIATMLDDPGVNSLWRNVFYQCGTVARRQEYIDQFENIVFEDDPGFADLAGGDFALRPDAPLFDRLAFAPIPFERIGLYRSPWRASWPVGSGPGAGSQMP